MVKIDRNFIVNGLINPENVKKDKHKYFLKLSKKYPYFNPSHVVNILISKKYNTVDYKKNLKKFSLNFVDRKYLYNILNNDKFFTKKNVEEIISDLNHFELKNKYSFTDWVLKTKSVNSEKKSTVLSFEKNLLSNIKYKSRDIDHSINKEDYITETLAKIYLKQNKFKKALKAYKMLSLKYPEKISLFADQIKFIKSKLKNE